MRFSRVAREFRRLELQREITWYSIKETSRWEQRSRGELVLLAMLQHTECGGGGWDRRRALSCSRAPPLGISCVELFQREAVKLGSLYEPWREKERERERERDFHPQRGLDRKFRRNERSCRGFGTRAVLVNIRRLLPRDDECGTLQRYTNMQGRRRVSLNWG